MDVEIIIHEHGLATEFPPEVTEAAEALSQDVAGEIARGREDQRDLFTITIDPVDARDFDDAISHRARGRRFPSVGAYRRREPLRPVGQCGRR